MEELANTGITARKFFEDNFVLHQACAKSFNMPFGASNSSPLVLIQQLKTLRLHHTTP